MKRVFITIVLLLGSLNLVKAQTDYCKDIKTTVDKATGFTNYDSPRSYLYLIKEQETDGSHPPIISFCFQTTRKDADYKAGGLYITFEDGTMWKDESRRVDCSYLSPEFGYRYGAVFSFDSDQFVKLAPFKTKKIVKVQITNVEIPVTNEYAIKFMAYVNCLLADIKK